MNSGLNFEGGEGRGEKGTARHGRGGAESHNAMSQRRVAWFAWLLLLMVLMLCGGGGGGGGGYCSFFFL